MGTQVFKYILSRISDVIVSIITSNVVDRGCEPWLGQTKDYDIGICCFSDKHPALTSKSKYRLARNHDYVSERSDLSTCRQFFQ
jgi:hypothetical protein